MMVNTLLATTAILALATANTFADSRSSFTVKPVGTLWNQNSNFAGGISSQNFTSGTYTSFNSAAADDFVVPPGKTWTVKEVDVTGVFYNGSGPAKSADITFYRNSKGLPGKIIKSLSCTGAGPDFACPVKGVKLTSGTKGTIYWVSLVANCSFTGGCGQWGWVTNTTVHHHQAVWENPGGSSCSTWCYIGSDLAFALKGKSF